MKIAIFLGSASDKDVAKEAVQVFKDFDVDFEVEVTSAHRTPERTVNLVREYEKKGCKLFIAVAGKAAHLAGVVAAHTLQPVIGVPVPGSAAAGFDALLSTVQMPKGVPVACMGLGSSGAANAALLAVQILSLQDTDLKTRLKVYRKKMSGDVEESSKKTKELF
jgi:phosphoribosylaminoimidazole carboxylase PurE protein